MNTNVGNNGVQVSQFEILELPRLVKLLQSQDHFDLFLQFGRFELGESKFMIEQLNDVEWASLIAIVEAYSARWQTYFTKTEYFAYFKEIERRTTQLI